MDHATANSRLSAYIDSELSPESRAALDAHLAICPACTAQLHHLQQTTSLLRQLPTTSPTSALLTRLHSAIDISTRRPIERFVGILSAIAACLAIIGGLLLMHTNTATAALPASWETNAVQLSDDSAATPNSTSPENALGQWMVSNLSSRGNP